MIKENKIWRYIRQHILTGLIPDNEIGVKLMGHRKYVGGMWDEIGNLQFDFMKKEGLKRKHNFLEIGCVSLRGGRHFIEYLDEKCYMGLDSNNYVVQRGIENDLSKKLIDEKKPEFQFNENFDFSNFTKSPDFSLSVSLFTHLNHMDIKLCLNNLRTFVDAGHRYYISYYEGNSNKNPNESHSLAHFEYSYEELNNISKGWKSENINDWGHPRGQK